MEYITAYNIPAIPITGSFSYDCLTDVSTVDRNQKEIYGFANNIVNFREVLARVDSKSKTLFQEQGCGNVCRVNEFSTDQFILVNGNVVSEELKFEYHFDDYEKRSPITISGKTTLQRKVA